MPTGWLAERGFAVATFPVAGLLAAAAALKRVFVALKRYGSTGEAGPLLPFGG